ncbi:hypothetical protein [Sphingomonas bacterium]|uniref:hypothetical protein n=1 Tax=Sphingomonas bacterium TaxID=1895847 RepID=UPI001575C28B|nr:hypothetical protein [Sphingomonas bacterium]
MFIDVTRYGGGRVLRVAVAAIAYLDACEGGSSLHLVGAEILRVTETPAEIEERAMPQLATVELVSTPSPTIEEVVAAYRLVVERSANGSAADEQAPAITADRQAGKGRR